MKKEKNPSFSAKPCKNGELNGLDGSDKWSGHSDRDYVMGVTPGKLNTNYMSSEINYQAPRLYDADGDLSQQWFIFFYCKNESGKWIRFKKTDGFNKLKTIDERHAHAAFLCLHFESKLREGWNPFTERRKYFSGTNCIQESPDEDSLKKLRVKYWVVKYLGEKSKLLRDKSISTYKTKLDRFTEWLDTHRMSAVLINQFQEKHAISYINDVQNGIVTTSTPSAKTRNSYKQTLESCWNWIISMNKDFKIINPWTDIQKLKVTKTRKVTFTEGERKKIFSHLENNDLYLFIVTRLVYQAFIRPGREMCGLQVKHFDLQDNKIWIPGSISKNKELQWVPLPSDVKKKMLELEIQKFPADYYIFGKGGPSQYKCGRDYWSKRFKKVMDKLKFPSGMTIYVMKHTGNKVAHLNGMPLKEQQRLNRHHSLDQMDQYLNDISASNSEQLSRYFPEEN